MQRLPSQRESCGIYLNPRRGVVPHVRGTVRDFRELKVWHKAHQVALEIYRNTRGFPPDERFGLTVQLRRAAVSMVSNIAEGCGRDSERDFARFFSIAAGSASEAEYQILLAKDLGYLSDDLQHQLDDQVNEVKRMLNAFLRTLS
jgi:four helix bundle protein